MISKPLDEIKKADIDALIAAKTAEHRTLDYKEVLSVNSDEEKREFLYDVSSFANAAGGDLVFGIRDQRDSAGKPTGIPEAAVGLQIANTGVETSRLENILQSSVAPRIPGLRFAEVPGFPSGPVLILRIPKSWTAPHMVTFKGVTRFYSRNSNGKYPLDVFEIRSAFALSESLPAQLSKFRDGRLANIVANEAPMSLPSTAKTVLHCVPISALDPASRLDYSQIYQRLSSQLRPIAPGGGWGYRFNFDGFLTSGSSGNYVQLFRSAAVEAIDVHRLDMKSWREWSGHKGPDFISLPPFEQELIEAVARYTQLQKEIGVSPPVFIMISLLGVKGFTVTKSSTSFGDLIDRDTLILPDVVLNDFPDSSSAHNQATSLLKPAFDALAQAAGLPGSPNYDANGNRVVRN